MAAIIASGTAAASSSDIVLAEGDAATLGLFAAGPDIPGSAVAYIERKASNGQYIRQYTLSQNEPSRVLQAVGTWRVSRPLSLVAFGVDQD